MNYTEKLLEVCDLHKVYTKDGVPTKALNGISFNVLNGEYLGIMGASGSGKTTLLNCIATVIKPTSGQILLSGANISSFDGTKLAETLLFPQVVYRLRHHYPCHPGTQCTFATEGEVGENFDEAIVQYVMGRIDIARIAVTYRQHLLGVEGV